MSLSGKKHPNTSCRFISEKGSVKQNLTIGITCGPTLHHTVFTFVCVCVCVVSLCSQSLFVFSENQNNRAKYDYANLSFNLVCMDTDMVLAVEVAAMTSSTRWFSSAPSWTWIFCTYPCWQLQRLWTSDYSETSKRKVFLQPPAWFYSHWSCSQIKLLKQKWGLICGITLTRGEKQKHGGFVNFGGCDVWQVERITSSIRWHHPVLSFSLIWMSNKTAHQFQAVDFTFLLVSETTMTALQKYWMVIHSFSISVPARLQREESLGTSKKKTPGLWQRGSQWERLRRITVRQTSCDTHGPDVYHTNQTTTLPWFYPRCSRHTKGPMKILWFITKLLTFPTACSFVFSTN